MDLNSRDKWTACIALVSCEVDIKTTVFLVVWRCQETRPTTMPATKDGLLTLELDPVLRVAGEEISGNVLLDFETLQRTPVQDICVYLNGSVFTYVVTL